MSVLLVTLFFGEAHAVFVVRCADIHTSISASRLKSVFRRDWDLRAIQREDSAVWRVNPRSTRWVQRFLDRNIPDQWVYDGEAVLIQREGRAHSAILYASSEKYGPSLVLISSIPEGRKEIGFILAELKILAKRDVISYELPTQVQELTENQ